MERGGWRMEEDFVIRKDEMKVHRQTVRCLWCPLPVQVWYLVHRCVYAADVALVVPAVMTAALQLTVVIPVTATAVQEELIDAPVLNLLTTCQTKDTLETGNDDMTTPPNKLHPSNLLDWRNSQYCPCLVRSYTICCKPDRIIMHHQIIVSVLATPVVPMVTASLV